MPSLLEALELLDLNQLDTGLHIVANAGQRVHPQTPTLVALGGIDTSTLLQRLRDAYPPKAAARLVSDGGDVSEAVLDDLTPERVAEMEFLFLAAVSWEADLRSFDTLVDIVAQLRAPDGCPWDKEQTHQSLGQYLLEETYEALEALDQGDMHEFPVELGDVLLQVVLHSQIGSEAGIFSLADVAEAINSKLVRRHPHVFGDVVADTAAEVAANWEVLKSRERGGASLLEGVPATLPALAYGQRVQDRAANVGFDWEDVDGVLLKIREEIEEYEQASSAEEREAELADVVFSLVNLGRRQGFDMEGALRQSNAKFVERFRMMETIADERGVSFPDMPLAEKDALWNEAKRVLADATG